MRYNKLVEQILEAVADALPPSPPAIVQRAVSSSLTFDDIFNFIKKHEGVKPHVYKDSLGIPTVGIGFNMMRSDARNIFNRLNLDYNSTLNGSVDLTDQQMKDLFVECLKIAYKDVKQYLPQYDELPREIKLGLIDMSFNLGISRLNKFVKTKEYILQGDYKAAAQELKKSKWASQVGTRSNSIINIFNSV